MLEEKDYIKWATKLGRDFKISQAVIRHVRSSYKDKYEGVSFERFRDFLLEDASDKLKATVRTHKPFALAIINTLSKDILGIDKAVHINGRIIKSIPTLTGNISKIGYRRAIIGFVKRMDKSQFNQIIEDIVDPELTPKPTTEQMVEGWAEEEGIS